MSLDAVVASTERLIIRHLQLTDADFIVAQLTDPGFLRYIGDRGVRNTDDALRYLRDGPIDSYQKNGFGLNAVIERQSQRCIGMCGVLKRETLPEPDLGYAFLPDYRAHGYALEAARAVLSHAGRSLHLQSVLAIVQPDNAASISLLDKLGFTFQQQTDDLLRYRLVLHRDELLSAEFG